MKISARTAQDIRRDLDDAQRRLRDLQVNGNNSVSDYDLMMGYDARSAIGFIEAHISYYEEELREATRHGEQLSMNLL